MSETSCIQTNWNRKQYRIMKLIRKVRQVTFFIVKIEKFVGGNLSFPVSGMLVGGIWLQVSV